jgi:hypothetical protein
VLLEDAAEDGTTLTEPRNDEERRESDKTARNRGLNAANVKDDDGDSSTLLRTTG